MERFVALLTEPAHIANARAFYVEQNLTPDQFTTYSSDAEIDLEATDMPWSHHHFSDAYQKTMFEGQFDEALERVSRLRHMPGFKDWAHNGVSFFNVLGPRLGFYVRNLFFYLTLYDELCQREQQTAPFQLIVFPTKRTVPETASVLSPHALYVPEKASRLAAQKHGVNVRVVGQQGSVIRVSLKKRWRRRLSQLVSASVIKLHNAIVMRYWQTNKNAVCFSGKWNYVGPLVHDLTDRPVYITLLGEITAIPWRELWQRKLAFINHRTYLTRADRNEARRIADTLLTNWRSLNTTTAECECVFRGMSYFSMLKETLDYVVNTDTREYVETVLGTKRMFERVPTETVVIYFDMYEMHVYTVIGKESGVFSIELQHGTIDNTHSYFEQHTDIHAVYGVHTKRALLTSSHRKGEHICPVGSPRFDEMAQLQNQTSVRENWRHEQGIASTDHVILFILPLVHHEIHPWRSFTTDITETFEVLARLRATYPHIQIVAKVRPGNIRADFNLKALRAYLGEEGILTDVTLPAILPAADSVITVESTTVFESMILEKPVTLLRGVDDVPPKFVTMADAGAITVAESPVDIEGYYQQWLAENVILTRQVTQGSQYLATHYSFDGKCNERIKALINTQLCPN